MTFGDPIWLWALLLLPVLAFFLARAEQRGAEKLQLFVAARLLPQLAGTVNRARRIFRFVLLLLVLALVLVSLARPRWGYAYDEVKRKGLDLLLAVDVSRSMLSNDVQPNRLERVKLATQDLINELQGDRVGLIAFAGRAFLQAPLTIDYSAAVDSINELDTKIIPEGGTNISEAIALATRTFGKAATGNRALIIFTDGEELSGDAVKTAKAASEAGVRIFAIGVGTPGGSLIPIQSENGGTAFVKDAKGEVVKSKLDETRLRELAQTAEGFYLHLENGPRTMKQLFSDGLGKMKVADINARLSRKPIERYEWPLAAAIFLFALALLINDRQRARTGGTGAVPSPKQNQGRHGGRPSSAIAAAILLLIVRQSGAASAGLELYEQQKFPEAYEHFQKTLEENPGTRQSDRIQFDAGAAAYKMKDYNKALQSFSQALLSKNPHLQSESHYNLGNTLYQRGEAEKSDEKKLTNWEGALQHYEETLKAEPQNKNAKDNYEYVKKKIEELKKKQDEKPSPTPTPSPSPSPQEDQKDDQKKDDKDQQQKDQQQQQNDDGSGQGQKSEDGQQSPSPTPSPSPSPSPGESPSPSPGDDQSPSPTPSPSEGEQSGASPTPSEEGTPSPTPGEGEQNGGENGEQPTPTPAGTPEKPLTGDVKGAGEEKPSEQQQAEAAEAEPEKEGEMSPKQAALLLQAMKDEEQKVQLDEHKPVRPVYNDW
ncbi:MAG: VWA domain-containing protein [Chthoniobacterales bacterium]|nr:VWA domain-containing protein [Chthoniobacterales bacterium]